MVLPLSIVRSDLPQSAKLLYGRLLLYAGKNGRCNPSHATLGAEIGVSPRQVSKLLASLSAAGLISWKRTRSTSLFHVVPLVKLKTKAKLSRPAHPGECPHGCRICHLVNMPYAEYLLTPEWKLRREEAIRIAGDRCQICNGANSLDVHHRTYANRGFESASDLTVLCRKCHGTFHGKLANEGMRMVS